MCMLSHAYAISMHLPVLNAQLVNVQVMYSGRLPKLQVRWGRDEVFPWAYGPGVQDVGADLHSSKKSSSRLPHRILHPGSSAWRLHRDSLPVMPPGRDLTDDGIYSVHAKDVTIYSKSQP